MKFKLICFSLIVLMASCAKTILPPYTSVNRLTELKVGMSPTQVKIILNIDSYDLLYMNLEGDAIYKYNYRLLDRNIIGQNRENRGNANEYSQTNGVNYYNKVKWVYLHYKNDKLQSIISETPNEESRYLTILEGKLNLVKANEYADISNKNENKITVALGEEPSIKRFNGYKNTLFLDVGFIAGARYMYIPKSVGFYTSLIGGADLLFSAGPAFSIANSRYVGATIAFGPAVGLDYGELGAQLSLGIRINRINIAPAFGLTYHGGFATLGLGISF